MAISCTVVIGPRSDMLGFLLRLIDCASLVFNRCTELIKVRSFSLVPFSPACDCSASACLPIDNLSLAGNSWYLRGSVG